MLIIDDALMLIFRYYLIRCFRALLRLISIFLIFLIFRYAFRYFAWLIFRYFDCYAAFFIRRWYWLFRWLLICIISSSLTLLILFDDIFHIIADDRYFHAFRHIIADFRYYFLILLFRFSRFAFFTLIFYFFSLIVIALSLLLRRRSSPLCAIAMLYQVISPYIFAADELLFDDYA